MTGAPMTPQDLIAALNKRRRRVESLWMHCGASPETPTYQGFQEAYRVTASRWIRALTVFNDQLGGESASAVLRAAAGDFSHMGDTSA